MRKHATRAKGNRAGQSLQGNDPDIRGIYPPGKSHDVTECNNPLPMTWRKGPHRHMHTRGIVLGICQEGRCPLCDLSGIGCTIHSYPLGCKLQGYNHRMNRRSFGHRSSYRGILAFPVSPYQRLVENASRRELVQ